MASVLKIYQLIRSILSLLGISYVGYEIVRSGTGGAIADDVAKTAKLGGKVVDATNKAADASPALVLGAVGLVALLLLRR